LASGFIEPLESTSIHLVQSGIAHLLANFPTLTFEQAEIDRYNRVIAYEYERVRDFIVLHYNATQRDDTELWNYCRTMSIPDSLQEKYDIFRSRGRVFRENEELFNDTSWFAVMIGQNIRPAQLRPGGRRAEPGGDAPPADADPGRHRELGRLHAHARAVHSRELRRAPGGEFGGGRPPARLTLASRRPSVSVIVPTLRRPEGLARAVRSVLAQTTLSDQTLEVVVVDNSPEASAQRLVQDLAGAAAVPVVYVHEPSPGVATARTHGVASGRGRTHRLPRRRRGGDAHMAGGLLRRTGRSGRTSPSERSKRSCRPSRPGWRTTCASSSQGEAQPNREN
jgi:hypothetical protein